MERIGQDCLWCSGGHSSNLPPKPVAIPTVPSTDSISTRNEPRTLIPQLVRDLRYCSHREEGVEMSLSMSLESGQLEEACWTGIELVPMATLHIVVITAWVGMLGI